MKKLRDDKISVGKRISKTELLSQEFIYLFIYLIYFISPIET